jgi:hypothetical protein
MGGGQLHQRCPASKAVEVIPVVSMPPNATFDALTQ